MGFLDDENFTPYVSDKDPFTRDGWEKQLTRDLNRIYFYNLDAMMLSIDSVIRRMYSEGRSRSWPLNDIPDVFGENRPVSTILWFAPLDKRIWPEGYNHNQDPLRVRIKQDMYPGFEGIEKAPEVRFIADFNTYNEGTLHSLTTTHFNKLDIGSGKKKYTIKSSYLPELSLIRTDFIDHTISNKMEATANISIVKGSLIDYEDMGLELSKRLSADFSIDFSQIIKRQVSFGFRAAAMLLERYHVQKGRID